MYKQYLITGLALVACGTVLAQAPKGTLDTPPAQTYPSGSGGAPAAIAQDRVNAKKAAGASTAARSPTAGPAGTTAPAQLNPMASGGTAQTTAEMGANARIMDTNRDGMISRKEWNSHHSAMWKAMQAKGKNGSVPWTEVESRMRGTPK